ncbi:MAG: SIR2 family protein [Acidobacteriota bacterium]|nr:SIR2 family protein [Acidobacteriota bacterium]
MATLRPAEAFDSKLADLADAARRRDLILFVGGGVSQSLGLPDFRELVQHLAREMALPDREIPIADYTIVAEAYITTRGHLGSLRSWMDTTWHPPSIDISRSRIHNLIIDLDFPTIYTTNYDRWLERAFEQRGRPYRKIVNVADLTPSREARTEIIKFHGDFEDDDSLVLTETSYFRRMTFETPLDIRLRADCLARPILFLGYSLHDLNTRYLLFRLQELWRQTPLHTQRPISYIFMLEPDPVQEIVLRSRGVEPIAWYGETPKNAAVCFLEALLAAVKARRTSPASRDAPRRRKASAARKPRRRTS